MTSSHYIGLMSGTSLDGVDGVLARLDEHGRIQVLAHAFEPFDASFRAALLQLNQRGDDELHLGALAGNQIARHYAQVAQDLGVSFFDASSVAKADPTDGVHLDQANTRALGEALAPVVQTLLKP